MKEEESRNVRRLFDVWLARCKALDGQDTRVPRCWRSAELREAQAVARRLILEIEDLTGLLPEDERDDETLARPLGRLE